MRRILSLILVCLVLLSGCSQSAEEQWQEQYDLGVRYLSEGNYEEAVIAFTAAIEIDPKRREAYSGLADAYMALGEYEQAEAVWMRAQEQELDDVLLTELTTQSEKYHAIRTALEAGEAGVWITRLAFDREVFQSGEETTFRLLVLCSVPETGEHQLQISANVEEPASWKWLGDGTAVPQGVSIQQLEISATPVQWEGRYFGLQVSLWNTGEDQWDFLARDTVYLTPEGAQTDHYAVRNSYGATEFRYRNNYLDFEAFTTAEQEFIASAASAVLAEDTGALRGLLGFDSDSFHQSYTIWNGYKVYVSNSGKPRLNDTGDEAMTLEIQLRPENGMGYYAHVYASEKVDLSMTPEDYWMDYYNITEIVSCPCVDWQWNGAVHSTERTDYFWRNTEGSTNDSTITTTISGTMADGVWDGTATSTTHEVADWTPWDDVDETTTTTLVYEGGVLVEKDGEPWDGGDGYHLIDNAGYGGVIYGDKQSFLDNRYW